MPFTIVRNDITKMPVDAIVNAANPSLRMGGGVCGAIFKAADAEKLQAECNAIGGCETGQAVITPGHNLPAKYIIHTPGPVWQGGRHGEETLLRGCYINSLMLAAQHGCDSVAFPLISSGIYGYPKKEALRVAVAAIQDFLRHSDMAIFLVVFDKAAVAISEQLLGAVKAYIDEHYVAEHTDKRRRLLTNESVMFEDATFQKVSAPIMDAPMVGLDALVGHLDEPFSQTLLRLIDVKGKTDVEVYKSANIDRKLFSKIRSNKAYMPSKKTAVALAIALELNLAETRDLLARAGYALSPSQKFDVIIEYFITNRKYDIFEINEVLFYYDQPVLGS